jgi:hypothetical protein
MQKKNIIFFFYFDEEKKRSCQNYRQVLTPNQNWQNLKNRPKSRRIQKQRQENPPNPR